MKRLIWAIPFAFLVIAFSFLWVYGAPVVQGPCTATQSAPASQDSSGNAVVPLHFSFGQGQTLDTNCNIPLGAPSTFLGDFVANTCNNLNNQSVAFSSAPGVGQIVPPTPPPTVTPPDPNAAIKNQFSTDYLALRQMETLVSHQVLVSTDTIYQNQITTVQNEFSANRDILLPLVPTGP